MPPVAPRWGSGAETCAGFGGEETNQSSEEGRRQRVRGSEGIWAADCTPHGNHYLSRSREAGPGGTHHPVGLELIQGEIELAERV